MPENLLIPVEGVSNGCPDRDEIGGLVSEMARMVGLSGHVLPIGRKRFPMPVYDVVTRRPVYTKKCKWSACRFANGTAASTGSNPVLSPGDLALLRRCRGRRNRSHKASTPTS